MSLPSDLMDFAGIWRIHREIDFTDRDTHARFLGEASLTPHGTGLIYSETGELRLGQAPPMRAERRYLWEPSDTGGIATFFDDGRPFHVFTLNAASQATHKCPPDTYRVAYAFHDWPAWTATWAVTGPKKAYTMVSLYTRPA
ncbi:MAG: DUF6314 family protein [Pseudomonadota bacterium]